VIKRAADGKSTGGTDSSTGCNYDSSTSTISWAFQIKAINIRYLSVRARIINIGSY
jgi:hypothetical protein